MSDRILLYCHRKPGTTPLAFKTHYETVHIPLMRSLAGPTFPTKHIRHYIARSADPPYSATVFSGSQQDFEYDVVVVMEFRDQEHAGSFFGKCAEPKVAKIMKEDCEKFMDTTEGRRRAVVLSE
ncbi:hypothetical protein IQ07DRAFT_640097 [Pyrenochaeta sp. DS3sAY3a]|nr:hypothetical protein IQ07DRAFT_640097 [Pyrenochaeta sp. DS3sAY3a]